MKLLRIWFKFLVIKFIEPKFQNNKFLLLKIAFMALQSFPSICFSTSLLSSESRFFSNSTLFDYEPVQKLLLANSSRLPSSSFPSHQFPSFRFFHNWTSLCLDFFHSNAGWLTLTGQAISGPSITSSTSSLRALGEWNRAWLLDLSANFLTKCCRMFLLLQLLSWLLLRWFLLFSSSGISQRRRRGFYLFAQSHYLGLRPLQSLFLSFLAFYLAGMCTKRLFF